MSGPLRFEALEQAVLPAGPVHLAIGMFDGVHLGHQSVIGAAVRAARQDGGLAGVLTFWPHPSRLLRPEAPTRLLLSREAKQRVLAKLELDFVIEQEFSREFARIGAEEFVPYLRRCLPTAKTLVVGENWRFGQGREGDVSALVTHASRAGLTVVSLPRLTRNGAPVSSSRIRTLLEAGQLDEANALLGYSYFCEGVVTPGRQLGREIGFPTLNLAWAPELQPRFGVYVVSVTDGRGATSVGVANFGLRPTVGTATEPRLEVHILGETGLGPADRLTVHWLRFLRPEKKFADIGELRAQIALDRQHALVFVAQMTRV